MRVCAPLTSFHWKKNGKGVFFFFESRKAQERHANQNKGRVDKRQKKEIEGQTNERGGENVDCLAFSWCCALLCDEAGRRGEEGGGELPFMFIFVRAEIEVSSSCLLSWVTSLDCAHVRAKRTTFTETGKESACGLFTGCFFPSRCCRFLLRMSDLASVKACRAMLVGRSE